MHQGFKIPVLRYYPNYLIMYEQRFDFPERSQRQIDNEKNLTRGDFNGFMSPKTKSKVKQYLTTWITSINEIRESKINLKTKKKPYLTFVTLTLPSKQKHTDNEIKRKCLIPFIQTIQRKHNVWNYYWRAESQKNGNIHFHLIIDSYIDHVVLRDLWNRHINNLHYVNEFCTVHNHRSPNSTDIHSLRAIKNAAAYLIKYVSKADGYRPIKGRIHGCSDRLRVLKPYECQIDSNTQNFLNEILADKQTESFDGDSYLIINYSKKQTVGKYEKAFRSKVSAYHLDLGIDLYCNREASKNEVEEAETLKAMEKESQQCTQSEFFKDSESSYNFYIDPSF